MKEKYNSHVVLSQTLLNGFSHKSREGKKIWVMGIKTGNITEKKVKEFNVVKKYFNEESEKIFIR